MVSLKFILFVICASEFLLLKGKIESLTIKLLKVSFSLNTIAELLLDIYEIGSFSKIIIGNSLYDIFSS